MDFQPNSCTDLSVITEPVFLIDWLTFTDHFHETPQDVMSFLGLSESKIPWTYQQYFRNGYPEHYFWNNITISFGSDNERWYDDPSKARTDMGICVNFSGQGCRAFETEGGDWLHLFKKMQGDIPWAAVKESATDFSRVFKKDRRYNVTRLDLAFDDHQDFINYHRIENDLRDRNFVSKSKKSKIIWSDDQDTDIQGFTGIVGSDKSKVFIRIYDKAAERGYKDRHWARCELQLRDDRAIVAMAQILRTGHVGKTVAGILRNYLSFRVPSADTNKSRWPIAPYWLRILGAMEKISLWIKPGEPYNLRKTEYWLKKQYGQVISLLSEIQDPQQLVTECREIYPSREFTPKYRQVLEDYKRNNPPKPVVRYVADGVMIDGQFYPFEQISMNDEAFVINGKYLTYESLDFEITDDPTPWDDDL